MTEFNDLHQKIDEKVETISSHLKKIIELSAEKGNELRTTFLDTKKAYSLIWTEVANSINPSIISTIESLKILTLPVTEL